MCTPHALAAGLAFITFLALAHQSLAGNCSAADPIIIMRETAQFTVGPSWARMRPASGGLPRGSASLLWDLTVLTERSRTFFDLHGRPLGLRSQCVRPDAGFVTFDPLAPRVPGQACSDSVEAECGELYSYLQVSDMDCWLEHQKDVPFLNGSQLESVVAHFTHPNHSTFSLRIGAYLTDKEVFETPVNSTGHPLPFQNHYKPNVLKISYDIYNYPWAGPTDYTKGPTESNSSFVALFWNTGLSGFPGNFSIGKAGVDRYVKFVSHDNTSSLDLVLQAIYVMDDYVHIDPIETVGTTLAFPIQDIEINMLTSLDICDTNPGHWNSFIFDPTLAALFSGPTDDPTAPPDSPAHSSKKGLSGPQKAAVGVTVAIILAIGIFVVIAMTVPPVKRFLRPATVTLGGKRSPTA